jgi:hypothetical protein
MPFGFQVHLFFRYRTDARQADQQQGRQLAADQAAVKRQQADPVQDLMEHSPKRRPDINENGRLQGDHHINQALQKAMQLLLLSRLFQSKLI